jgi:post-segregation antitoxin (ccd killing protein)
MYLFCMNKIRTTITIDKNLLKVAKKHNIKISTFLHNSLTDYLK